MSPLRVLYAEDNEMDADLTRSHFVEHAPDFALEIVPTGRACLERLAAAPPDLLLVDHHLPDMEGLDVLRHVAQAELRVPMVLVTGVGDEELVVTALRLGASNYVPKAGNYLQTLPQLLRTEIEKHRLKASRGELVSARPRILYVEHDPADIDLTLRHFAEAAPHFNVEVMRTCHDALDRLPRAPAFDAALIDLRMPDQSGLDFVREAGRRGLALPPFVMISGKGDEAAALASLTLGAADYLPKREGYRHKLPYLVERAIAYDRLGRVNEQLRVQLAERQRVEAALREANRGKDEYLGLLSHELRNPLMPIRAALYILERVPPGGEQARRAQATLDRQVAHLARLVDDLLEATRIARGKVQLQRSRVELDAVVTRAVEDHRALFAERGIQLELRVGAGPLVVDGDATRLAQLMGNLLHNAAKFTDRGGRATVDVTRDAARDQAVVRVSDTGVGIPADVLPRLFEPFTQADHTLDRSRGGLGLGLAMVKGLVELHGGEVTAHSDGAGRGATFTVCLPLEAAASIDAAPRAAAPPPARPARVLVIEDNTDAADALREAVQLDGHAVEVAYDGAEGLTKLRAHPFDVVLCDIGLPGMNGYDVARYVRSHAELRDVVLVALTGYARPEEVARAQDAGFDHHMAKPPDLDRLCELLSASAGHRPA